MSVAGTYDCVTKTPMGDQSSKFTVEVSGDTFTGSNAGPTGTMAVENGKVDGDALTGSVTAGMFGTFPMNGTRA